MKNLERKLELALKEIERLNQENHQLKKKIADMTNDDSDRTGFRRHFSDSSSDAFKNDPIAKTEPEKGNIHNYSTPIEKITLFRSLFRGREDVYPNRWESKTGKSGYSPACKNEWSFVCKKPQIKCTDCSHRQFLPITDEIVSNHLDAKINRTIGIYPMLEDETCWFVAIDFDKQNWKQDAAAVMDTCRELQVHAALERSRSGNGGHIWIFFDQPIEAALARKFGCALLTKTMENRYELGLDSYDRLFPNQDTLPKGGFGNLIALPLQGSPRKEGNSVFVDENFTSYEDQWSFLSGLKKMTLFQIEDKLHEMTRNSNVLNVGIWDEDMDEDRPWEKRQIDINVARIAVPLPAKIRIILSNMIYIENNGLPAWMINEIRRLASFQNPDFYKTQAMRLPTFGKPRVIGCAEYFPKHIALPRGCLQLVSSLFEKYGVELSIADERNKGTEVDVSFTGQLSILQDAAARSILAHDTGILSATTAFGKTVVAASIIASRKVNTLVLVHRRELMDQWKERLSTFLNLSSNVIGVIGGGKEKRTGVIDIAIIQSLNNKGQIKDYLTEYGQIIVDECHHVSAFSFEQVLKKANAKYVVGLTATLTRQDGQQPIVLMQCGPIRTRIDAKSQAFARGFEHKVLPRYTSFQLPALANPSIQTVYQLLVEDKKRNELIFDDLLKCLDQGRSPILLAERTAHVEYFEKKLEKFAKNVIVLRGGMGKKQREELRQRIANIPDTEERVFIATGKLIGEGFDDARLDTLFLVHPISWKGSLQQYAGRLHRSHANKQDVQIYDYVDIQVPILMSMYRKRVKGYRVMGYSGMEL